MREKEERERARAREIERERDRDRESERARERESRGTFAHRACARPDSAVGGVSRIARAHGPIRRSSARARGRIWGGRARWGEHHETHETASPGDPRAGLRVGRKSQELVVRRR